MNRDLIDELQVGTRTIAGTEFPVVDQLRRDGRRWQVVRELCNGVPRLAETHDTEREARAAFGTRLEGRKPREQAAAPVRIAIRITEAEHAAWGALQQRQGQKYLADTIREAMALAVARGSTK